jgi:hypothetical protein
VRSSLRTRFPSLTLTASVRCSLAGWQPLRSQFDSDIVAPSSANDIPDNTLLLIFAPIDEEMITQPLTIMSGYETTGLSPRSAFRRLVDLQALLRTISGSCALAACVYTGRNRLHLAVTGDSRAVMGTWPACPDGRRGSWRTQVLTEDQTGFNPAELARYQVIQTIRLCTLTNTSSDFVRNIRPQKMRRLSSTAGPSVVLARLERLGMHVSRWCQSASQKLAINISTHRSGQPISSAEYFTQSEARKNTLTNITKHHPT